VQEQDQEDTAAKGATETLNEKRSGLSKVRARLVILDLPVPDWPVCANRNWRRLIDHCRSMAEAWMQRKTALEQAEKELTGFSGELQGPSGNTNGLRFRSMKRQPTLPRQRSKRGICLRSERGKLFDGQPTGKVRSELRRVRSGSEQRKSASQTTRGEAQAAFEAANSLANQARSRLQAEETTLEQAMGDLETARGRFGITTAQLERSLQHDTDWANREEVRLIDIHEEVMRASTVLVDRQRALEIHKGRDVPTVCRQDIASLLQDCDAQIKKLNEAQITAEAALKADNERRIQSANISKDLEERRAKARVVEPAQRSDRVQGRQQVSQVCPIHHFGSAYPTCESASPWPHSALSLGACAWQRTIPSGRRHGHGKRGPKCPQCLWW